MKISKTSQNLINQALGQGLGKGAALLYTLLLPRLLGVSTYGKFSFFYTVCILSIQPLLELGLDLILVKLVSQGHSKSVSEILALKGISALLVSLTILALALLFGWPLSIIFSLYFYILFLSIQRTCFAYQRGEENMLLENIISPAQKILCIVFVLLFYYVQLAADLIAPCSLLISALITTIPVLYFCRDWLSDGLYRPLSKPGLMKRFQEGIYLAGISVLGLIYFRIDSVMLGMMIGLDEVANYDAAYRLIEGLIYFPSVLMAVYFPKLAKSKQDFTRYFYKVLKFLTLMGLILTLVVFLAANLIIETFYGSQWSASISLLKCLSLSLFPICLGHLMTQALIVCNRQKVYFLTVVLATLQNVLLNLVLIPQYKAFGASVSTFITEVSITLICLYWLHAKRDLSY